MPGDDDRLLEISGLRISVPGRILVDALDMTLGRGEFVAVLGRNGTGKTLSLLTLAGLREADRGAVRLCGEVMGSLRRRRVARRLALLPQDTEDIFPATVLDTALVGRHPHIGRFRWESPEDHDHARASLATVGLGDLADRDVLSLSGGERRRVALCRLLLSKPDMLLLDEPTNHLDAESVAWLERFLADYPGTVVAITHDRYFLDNAAGWILELDRGRGIPYEGNYSDWLNAKEQRLEQEARQEASHQKSWAEIGSPGFNITL